MRTSILAISFALNVSIACAQTPIERLPAGSLISGWAVEAIPERMGESASIHSRSNIADYIGQAGIARLSTDSNRFSSNQFDQMVGIRQHLAFNGRAFLRVQAPQRYVIFATPFATVRGTSGDCQIEVRVGGTKVIGNVFSTSNERIARRSQASGDGRAQGLALPGVIDLQPGFYPVEFVAGCLDSYEPAYLEIRFNIREEHDPIPRDFGKDELFHVRR